MRYEYNERLCTVSSLLWTITLNVIRLSCITMKEIYSAKYTKCERQRDDRWVPINDGMPLPSTEFSDRNNFPVRILQYRLKFRSDRVTSRVGHNRVSGSRCIGSWIFQCTLRIICVTLWPKLGMTVILGLREEKPPEWLLLNHLDRLRSRQF